MFLTVRNPHGEVVSLALNELPVWILELRATRYRQQAPTEQPPEGEDAPKDEPRTLALGIVSVVAGAKVFNPIAAIDLKTANGEVGTIAADGFARSTATANKEHLRDRLNMLHNGATGSASAVDELIAKASVLADIHGAVCKALWGTQSSLDASAAALLKGEFEGWMYAITRTRFEAIFVANMASAEGMGAAPSQRPPPPPPGSSKRKPPTVVKESESTAPVAGSSDSARPPPPTE